MLSKGFGRNGATMEDMRQWYEEHGSLLYVADRAGMSRESVRELFVKIGQPRRPRGGITLTKRVDVMEHADEICALYCRGALFRELQERFSTCRHTIVRIIRSRGLRPRPYTRKHEYDVNWVSQAWIAGRTTAQIAEGLGISVNAVRTAIRDLRKHRPDLFPYRRALADAALAV